MINLWLVQDRKTIYKIAPCDIHWNYQSNITREEKKKNLYTLEEVRAIAMHHENDRHKERIDQILDYQW